MEVKETVKRDIYRYLFVIVGSSLLVILLKQAFGTGELYWAPIGLIIAGVISGLESMLRESKRNQMYAIVGILTGLLQLIWVRSL